MGTTEIIKVLDDEGIRAPNEKDGSRTMTADALYGQLDPIYKKTHQEFLRKML